MKLRLYKKEMRKVCWFYTNKLYEMHLGAVLTPAKLEIIKNDLHNLQQRMQKSETNQIWHVPVGLFVTEDHSAFEVVVTDESNLLYLDFDQP